MLATIHCQVCWSDTTPVARRTVEAHQVLYGHPGAVEFTTTAAMTLA